VRLESSRISRDDFLLAIEACHTQQVRDFCPSWGLLPRAVFEDRGNPRPPGCVPCVVRDSHCGDPNGAIAWHDETGITVLADRLENGLAPPLGHECCEAGLDAPANEWSDRGDGSEEALEVCDRVQGETYSIDVARQGGAVSVLVTDFLLPEAFSGLPSRGAVYDFCGVLASAREIAPGGYAITRRSGVAAIEGDVRAALAHSRGALLRLGAIG
jgi:hypothetical protein